MLCITDGILRAKVDGELSQTESIEVENHLASCATCRERAGAMARQAGQVGEALHTLEPLPGEDAPDAELALARFKSRARQAAVDAEAPSLVRRLFAKRLRPAWGVVVFASLVAAFLSFAPARSWAQKVLAMLRVQKIAVVSVNPESIPGPNGNRTGQMISQMLSDNIVVTVSPGKPQRVTTVDQASQLAGFKVRVLSSRLDPPQFRVEGEQAFHMTVDRDRVQAILNEAGRPDLQLPASLDGATIAVHIPKVVMTSYGCPNLESRDKANPPAPGEHFPSLDEKCVLLAQVPSPIVSVPRDLDVAQLAEAALQVGGMSAEEAHAFCQTVDWTSTLVLPLPRHVTSYQKVDVDGVEGTLINMPPERRHGSGYTLLWVKSGMIYSLVGFGSSSEAVPLAESLD